uniref:Large ribosomal subunit protein uL23c n=1 Tax=Melanothamnus harveyi TaxID=397005 RepID=A0A1Z1MH81_MELHR|nr:ribosomal protein L23 [Melanothamnus harveyi]ARW65428.1 ribosomal protein L23 [Melanothamnus harveyi]
MKKNKIDIIRYPVITDKTTKEIENNTYCFNVTANSNKKEIKIAIEEIFKVKVKKVNTITNPPKTKTVGRFKGKKTNYKKALIKLVDNYKINLFDEE